MTSNRTLTPTQAYELPRLLDAFAAVLEHEDVTVEIIEMLANELGDVGGARYGLLGGAANVAKAAREHANALRATFPQDT